jgi:prepilin-type N-terminal cleavage/methylation domain-containing protein
MVDFVGHRAFALPVGGCSYAKSVPCWFSVMFANGYAITAQNLFAAAQILRASKRKESVKTDGENFLNSCQGFTLIELLAVLTIILILAACCFPLGRIKMKARGFAASAI